MSEIKALDMLREIADKLDDAAANVSEHGFSPIAIKTSLLCDEIEAEINERFMALPLDADGVPIHMGDNLHSDETRRDFPCRGYNLTLQGSKKWWTVECCYDSYSGTSEYVSAKSCHHVKSRTLEDVLIDAMQFGFSSHAGDDVTEKAREFADEIRELLGGDAE